MHPMYTPNTWNVGDKITKTKLDRLEAAAKAGADGAEGAAETYVRTVNGVPVDPVTGDVEIDAGAADAVYKQLARTPEVLIAGAIVRDSNGAATSAPVVWPDGSLGTYTATTVSTSFPGAVDAYAITYGSPATKTYTQPAVTRDISGAATAVPAIVVS